MPSMHREPPFQSDDTVIWVSSLLLAVVLGSVAAYALSIAVAGVADIGTTLKEMLGLTGAGVALIALALHGRLVKAFLLSFAAVFFIVLAVATHGFAAL